ncbi:MAG: hypothetical protein ACRCYQ_13130 [Nocardioides sp.]
MATATCLLASGVGVGVGGLRAHSRARLRNLQERLAIALAQESDAAVRAAVAEITRFLGDRVGVPEVPDTYLPIPTGGRWLSPDEARVAFVPALRQIEEQRWWTVGLDPLTLGHPLREPASVVSALVAACRGGLEGAEAAMPLAEQAADFLIWAQEQCGTGGFPFPASRGVSRTAPFLASQRYLEAAERDGRIGSIVTRGWITDDGVDGGLQFDNGESGVALFDLYDLTGRQGHLDAAKRSADWALNRPLVPNWNYNSFSVALLARAYRATGEPVYLEGAIHKAIVGVLPGQLAEGRYAGRWYDAHNARPAYHYLVLSSLIELAVAVPDRSPSRAKIQQALELGLRSRNLEIVGRGAPNLDQSISALVKVNLSLKGDGTFLDATSSAPALDALGRLVSHRGGRGAPPLAPREWAHFLAYARHRGTPMTHD